MRAPRMCGVERDTRASLVRLGMHGGAGGLGVVFGGVVSGGDVALLHSAKADVAPCEGWEAMCPT